MKTVPLHKLFHLKYGHQLNHNAMVPEDDGINFIGRSRRRLGIVSRVAQIPSVAPCPEGLITVSLGGSYLLSAFVQPEQFYTAQNIKVLTPLTDMSFRKKVFYCYCIGRNRFRYSSHGREANRSIDNLLVPDPDDIPAWIDQVDPKAIDFTELDSTTVGSGFSDKADFVPLSELFDLFGGINPPAEIREAEANAEYLLPLLRPSKNQFSSYAEYVDKRYIDSKHIYPPGTLYISTNGQGSHTYSYVSPFSFVPNSDVTVAIPKSEMSVREKLFYAMTIGKNRPLFSYGRKPKGGRLGNLMVPARPSKYVYDKSVVETVLGH